jgi:glycosyltransferase XagB
MTTHTDETTRIGMGTALSKKVRRLIYGPERDPHMSPILSGMVQVGFRYKGEEFIHLTDVPITESAFFNLLRHQKIFLGIFFWLLIYAFIINWQITAIALFGVITVLYFLDLLFSAFIVFKSYTALPEIRISKEELAGLRDEDCPTYTIFCPLYKEWQVVPQFVEAMQKLDYPHEKLQVLFLLEENDAETIQKIRASSLPSHFHIVVVPHGKPKTKPKAMNYGLNYVRGEYVVIYDAEDVPEVDQLKKAVLAFKKVDRKVVCIQAKLNFYNPHQNILTKLFTAEYSLWFDLVLPGFQSISAPIPLGGTSNHFRRDTLRELGGWDAFNVTEDCDLGMRLAKRGYQTAIVDSTTYEEANSDLLNWYNQRSRWIKGYMQTYFVHMRSPEKYFAQGKSKNFFFLQLIVGGKILSLFINPLMWITTICYFLFRAKLAVFIEPLFPGPILYIGTFSLIFGNFFYLYSYMVGCVNRGYDEIIKYVFLIPLYWLGMSFAAWQALYEIIVKPHYWAKTVHGFHLAPLAHLLPHAPKSAFVAPVLPEGEPKLAHLLIDDTEKETWVVKIRAFVTSSAGLLVLSSIVANILNFAFNAYLGRVLTLADFGTITILNVFVYLLSLFTGALSATVTHEVSFFEGMRAGLGSVFFQNTRRYVLSVGFVASLAWLIVLPDVGTYFNIANPLIILAFMPAIIFAALLSLNNGYLQGTFSFGSAAAGAIFEVVVKLSLAVALVTYGFSAFASLAIPGSMVAAWLVSTLLVRRIYRSASHAKLPMVARKKFPAGFYIAALISGISVAAFLTTDVILATHYLSPDDAGRYALLSLVGKMIFFFGSLLNAFIMPVVSRAAGEKRDAHWAFAKLFGGAAFLTTLAALGLGVGGFYFVPLLLGARAVSIVPYVPLYSFAIALFTLSSTIALYGLARKRYAFSAITFGVSLALWWSIALNHSSIEDFVTTITAIYIFEFVFICFVHLFYERLAYLGRNISDAFRVFQALPRTRAASLGKMNILIFNWRDSESVFAGGAETYIHALAERWVAAGHAVTLFTSNDGTQKPNGVINGIRVIRRGGFYGVYALAPLYYLFKFREQFDAIVDCENGIPFFMPLVAKEPVYCLLHHIHQNVFRKSLAWPLATLARSLEKDLMPLVYTHSAFITVSQSSKRDMLSLQITDKDIEVIYPGVDLDFLTPGEKSPTPQVAYVGRLKEYKSVDVLIKAFATVRTDVPGAKLVIAGDGDDMGRLKKVVADLKLTQQVTFLGKVSEEKKLRILQESWVCVNPSMMEGWGITVIEANACGTPVVASDVPGLRDSVRDGETGLLAPYGDSVALAGRISLILTDEAMRRSFSHQAIVWAQNFDWNTSSEKFINAISPPAYAPPTPGILAVQRI